MEDDVFLPLERMLLALEAQTRDAIDHLENDAKKRGVSLYNLIDTSGALAVSGLLTARAQVLSSLVSLHSNVVKDEQNPGVWMVYDYNYTPYVISIHTSAEAAAREGGRVGGKVAFWPFGSDLYDAVKAWENRTPK